MPLLVVALVELSVAVIVAAARIATVIALNIADGGSDQQL
jgi:hypothetical protein